jgi:hypothetical protein
MSYLEREKRSLLCQQAIEQLERASHDLGPLLGHIDSLIGWWEEMDMRLEAIHHRVEDIRGDTINQIRIQSLGTQWEQVQGMYGNYKHEVSIRIYWKGTKLMDHPITQIAKLQDHYPRSLPHPNPMPPQQFSGSLVYYR